MKLEKVSLGETHSFSPIFLDYLQGKEALQPFYNFLPSLDNLHKAMTQKAPHFTAAQRQTLVAALQAQYQDLPHQAAVAQNIESLAQANTYTVTTGHQLNLFTGPVFFIYKLVTAINTARRLKEAHPDQHFVPVYWMATEDHDFAEINHFNLFGQDIAWQAPSGGPVGRMALEGIEKVFESLPEAIPLFEQAYTQQPNLAAATRAIVHELMGRYGLVVLDADDASLKKALVPVVKNDVLTHKANALVEAANSQLEALGYKTQVFPRHINFFYIEQGIRARIVKQDDGTYKALNTELAWTEAQLLALIEQRPECFSPNVILRPLYQELILPNIAYIGGPAEVAYWMQLKPVFDHFEVPFPVVMPRNFATVINKGTARKYYKTDVSVPELFLDTHTLVQQYVQRHTEQEIDLGPEQEVLAKLFDSIGHKAAVVDKSLTGFVGAEHAKVEKMLSGITKRLKKAEEKKHETAINQLEKIKEKLFPGGGLQERKENVLNYSLNNPDFIPYLLENFDPFDFCMNVVIEDE